MKMQIDQMKNNCFCEENCCLCKNPFEACKNLYECQFGYVCYDCMEKIEQENNIRIQTKIQKLKEEVEWLEGNGYSIKDQNISMALKSIFEISLEDYSSTESEMKQEVERYNTAIKCWDKILEH